MLRARLVFPCNQRILKIRNCSEIKSGVFPKTLGLNFEVSPQSQDTAVKPFSGFEMSGDVKMVCLLDLLCYKRDSKNLKFNYEVTKSWGQLSCSNV